MLSCYQEQMRQIVRQIKWQIERQIGRQKHLWR